MIRTQALMATPDMMRGAVRRAASDAARNTPLPSVGTSYSSAKPKEHSTLRATSSGMRRSEGQATRDPAVAHGQMSTSNPHTPDGLPATAEWVLARLEEAGATLLSIPNTGHSTRLRMGTLRPLPDAEDALHAAPGPVRAPVPSAACVDRMDQAFVWVSLIPEAKFVLRRVVHARALVNPLTGKHLFAWRRLAATVGADHKAVQRWHAQGVDIIVAALNRPLG